MSLLRSRWAAVGAAVAVTLGAGGVSLTQATIDDGDKPVFVAITPCRLVDTRPATHIGPRTTPLGAGDTLTLQVTGSTGRCTGIPGEATAAAMNVTAIQGTAWSFLTVYPADAALPDASHLNWDAGDPPTPNQVDVELSPTGAVRMTNAFGTVHVAADLVGYHVDHTHDDRYYTQTQSDDRFVSAHPGSVRISAHEMRPGEQVSNWEFAIGWRHQPPTTVDQCVSGRIGLPVGTDVTGMSIVYGTLATTPTVQVGLITTKASAGSLIGASPPVAMETLTPPMTGIWEFGETDVTVAQPTEVLAGYDYVVLVCTKDLFEIVGATVTLS